MSAGFICPASAVHIFLTGDIQVGKSTIIRRFLEQTRLPADGFVTYWERDSRDQGTAKPDSEGSRSLWLSPYSKDLQTVNRYLLLREVAGSLTAREDAICVFSEQGRRILKESGRKSIIIMDELGFLESKSAEFQQAVMEHLAGDVPVLGVIKPVNTEFLDGIRAHPGVLTYEVTAENREAAFQWLTSVGLA